jgi:hypothetical protein
VLIRQWSVACAGALVCLTAVQATTATAAARNAVLPAAAGKWHTAAVAKEKKVLTFGFFIVLCSAQGQPQMMIQQPMMVQSQPGMVVVQQVRPSVEREIGEKTSFFPLLFSSSRCSSISCFSSSCLTAASAGRRRGRQPIPRGACRVHVPVLPQPDRHVDAVRQRHDELGRLPRSLLRRLQSRLLLHPVLVSESWSFRRLSR